MLHFDLDKLDPGLRIEEISWAPLPYKRPRIAGKNARLDTHGWGGEVPIARLRAGDIEGFGWCTLGRAAAELFTGLPLRALFREDGMLRPEYRGLEFPLLDWLGRFFHQPVYRLAAREPERVKADFSVPVYDTTIYFDELHLQEDKAAVDFILGEAAGGLERGHRHFKIKIGRGALWMSPAAGLRRDLDIVRGIRGLAGPGAKLMVDANNGYNLNIAKEFLSAAAEAKLYWLEEAFHEDNMLYANLKGWMKEAGIETLIADGEGLASPALVEWAKKGLVDVIQYDLRSYGFFNWMELCAELEPFGILCAPHNYGGFYGNYAQGHFAACTDRFAFAEFDAADAEGIDTSAYRIREGRLEVPALEGFGLALDGAVFEKYREAKGYRAAVNPRR
jgi:L-alanine-DL-glutamate epimerase-like enolase superfamily enzyme